MPSNQIQIHAITPAPKPRMTKRDKAAATRFLGMRPPVARYFAFKDECRIKHVSVPVAGSHIIFVLPMPVSWSKKKRAAMDGQPHQQTPDKDNLEKALLDALYDQDCTVWDSRVTKMWGRTGQVIIKPGELPCIDL